MRIPILMDIPNNWKGGRVMAAPSGVPSVLRLRFTARTFIYLVLLVVFGFAAWMVGKWISGYVNEVITRVKDKTVSTAKETLIPGQSLHD